MHEWPDVDWPVDPVARLHLSRSQLQELLQRVGVLPIDRRRHIVCLSERNIAALLSKLDRRAAGEATACTIVKRSQDLGVPFNQSIDVIEIIAVEDADWAGPTYSFTVFNTDVVAVDNETYYAAQRRPAGEMVDADEQRLAKPSTGVQRSEPI